VNVLAVVHGDSVPTGTFGEVVTGRGHALSTWMPALAPAPPHDAYDAVMIFGGAMHVDQEAHHPWLRQEERYVRGLLEWQVPVFGVCLGAQLVAKAAGAEIGPAREPEVGWCEVELTAEAPGDPVLGALPRRFTAFQWHFYGFDVPAGGRELARSPVGAQAFRLGDAAWGVQFHPEVTREIVAGWIEEAPDEAPPGLLAETNERMRAWEKLGRDLCGAFLDAVRGETAERPLPPPQRLSS
jgi:GMP synthase (glutamine-hydrolysing)